MSNGVPRDVRLASWLLTFGLLAIGLAVGGTLLGAVVFATEMVLAALAALSQLDPVIRLVGLITIALSVGLFSVVLAYIVSIGVRLHRFSTRIVLRIRGNGNGRRNGD